MKNLIRNISIVLAVAGLALALTLSIYWNDIKRLPEIASGFYAKEFCSCLYVTEQSETYCRELVRQYIQPSKLEVHQDQKLIQAEVLGATRSASWTSERFGCVLNQN